VFRGSNKISLVGLLALLGSGCGQGPERLPSIGEAYVGPAVLKIRHDIPLESPVVATVKHGDHLEILQHRRRFFRVRTPSGAEGWTDERQLLAKEDMQRLKDLMARAARMPAQGQATTFGELNVHTQPSRLSPSFLQVKEGEKVDVLTHAALPRTEAPRKPLIPPAPKKPLAERKPAKEPKYAPLAPLPKPPGPPADWLDLSKTDLSQEEASPEEDDKDVKPVALDNWSLIRAKSGESGWVLTRRLVMAIPDEVAQYAEGRRIVSYFSLGEVQDDTQKKRNWLWTTVADGVHPYDFDSFRVFIWSLHRHRYETAYIERNLHGYAPVVMKEVEFATPNTKGTAKFQGFSLCVEKSDGQRYRREFAFISNIVRFAGERPCESAPPEAVVAQAPLTAGGSSAQEGPAQEGPRQGTLQRFRTRLRAITRSWFGK
jgi:hypothetical protein